jgi:hypothetical protein
MLALVAIQAAAGTLKISDAARLYARQGLGYTRPEANVEDLFQIDADLAWPKLQLGLEYAPRVVFVDVGGSNGGPPLFLHGALAQLTLREERYTLTVTQSGSAGEQNFSQVGGSVAATTITANAMPASRDMPMPNTPQAPMSAMAMNAQQPPTANPSSTGGLVPNARAVKVANEETAARLDVAWTRRLRSELRGSFGFSGGADPEARMLLPRQRRAQLDASLGFDRTRLDRISTVLTGAQIETSNGYDHWLASALENWSTRFDPESSLEVGAGLAFQDSLGPMHTRTSRVTPVGSLSFAHENSLQRATLRFQFAASYFPDVNVLLGRLQDRLQASSTTSLITPDLTASLLLAASQTLPASASTAATLISMTLTLEYEFVTWLAGQVGGQVARQALGQKLKDAPPPYWLAYVGVIAHAPALQF